MPLKKGCVEKTDHRGHLQRLCRNTCAARPVQASSSAFPTCSTISAAISLAQSSLSWRFPRVWLTSLSSLALHLGMAEQRAPWQLAAASAAEGSQRGGRPRSGTVAGETPTAPKPKRGKSGKGEATQEGGGAAEEAGASQQSGKHESKEEPGGKGKRGNKKKLAAVVTTANDEEMDIGEILVAMAKLSLNSSQTLRHLVGCSLTTFLVDSSKACIVQSLSSSKLYDKTVREAGKGHQMGPPHLHVAASATEVFVADEKFKEAFPLHHGLLEKFLGEAKKDKNVILDSVSYFRVKPCFQKGEEEAKAKITFAINVFADIFGGSEPLCIPLELHSAFVKAIVFQEGERKFGPPPKSEVERAVERVLNKMQGKR
jgi:hypothetical protein